MADLKPCPFCGRTDKRNIIEKTLLGEYRVGHTCKCLYVLGRKFYKTEAQAIEAWNTRNGGADNAVD